MKLTELGKPILKKNGKCKEPRPVEAVNLKEFIHGVLN